MIGPFRRGDLDELRQEGLTKANIPQPAPDFGFTFGCRSCGSNAFCIRYAGAGVLQLKCVDCGKRFVPIAVAEGQAHSKSDLGDVHKSFPPGIGGRNN